MDKIIDTKVWGTIEETKERIKIVEHDLAIVNKAQDMLEDMKDNNFRMMADTGLNSLRLELAHYLENKKNYIKMVDSQEKGTLLK